MGKIKKLISFIGNLIQQPSLINLVNNSQEVNYKKFKQKYPQITAIPQVEISSFNNSVPKDIESFLLDGSSLITDLQLLVALANRSEIKSYLEIGTWRGESVHNVAKYINDCTTINLSTKEIESLGFNPKYAQQHGILSKRNPNILHLEGNTKTFDFAALNKKYDLIFIDGDHSYEMVLNDTQKVFRHLLHEKSIVVWHDYAFSPQRIRYGVFQGILDGVGKENHSYLYHPKNTMCAVFIREKLNSSVFDEMKIPEKLFKISIEEKQFSQD